VKKSTIDAPVTVLPGGQGCGLQPPDAAAVSARSRQAFWVHAHVSLSTKKTSLLK